MSGGAILPAPPAGNVERTETWKKVEEAARGLEAVLLRQMLAAMEKAQLESGLFGTSPGSGALGTAFDLMLTEALGESAPLGLASQLASNLEGRQDQLNQLLEAGNPDLYELVHELDFRPSGFDLFQSGAQESSAPSEE